MANEDQIKRKKRRSRLLLLGLFLLILLAAAAFFIGGNSNEWVSKVPFIGSYFEETKKTVSEVSTGRDKKADEMQAEIASLNKTLTQKEAKIDELKDDLSVMKQRAEDEPPTEENNTDDAGLEDVADMYASMSPANAAEILGKLKDEEAVEILSAMKNEVAARIMEKMPRDQAAQVTRLLTETQALEGGETQ